MNQQQLNTKKQIHRCSVNRMRVAIFAIFMILAFLPETYCQSQPLPPTAANGFFVIPSSFNNGIATNVAASDPQGLQLQYSPTTSSCGLDLGPGRDRQQLSPSFIYNPQGCAGDDSFEYSASDGYNTTIGQISFLIYSTNTIPYSLCSGLPFTGTNVAFTFPGVSNSICFSVYSQSGCVFSNTYAYESGAWHRITNATSYPDVIGVAGGLITFPQPCTNVTICMSLAFAQITFIPGDNDTGTKMSVIPTTSAFWRAILPTEDLPDFLFEAGLANIDGIIMDTNNLDPELVTNLLAGSSNSTTLVLNFLATNQFFDDTAVQGVYAMVPATTSVLSNTYVMDCGMANAVGQKLVFADVVTASNNVAFTGVTNCKLGSTLSFDVSAVGGDRLVTFPTNLFLASNGTSRLSTNSGLWSFQVVGDQYGLYLTNNHTLRFSFQSNYNGFQAHWLVVP